LTYYEEIERGMGREERERKREKEREIEITLPDAKSGSQVFHRSHIVSPSDGVNFI